MVIIFTVLLLLLKLLELYIFAFTFKTKIKFGHGYVMHENFPILEQAESSFSQIEQIRHWQECVALSQVSLWSPRLVVFHGENRSPLVKRVIWTDVTCRWLLILFMHACMVHRVEMVNVKQAAIGSNLLVFEETGIFLLISPWSLIE